MGAVAGILPAARTRVRDSATSSARVPFDAADPGSPRNQKLPFDIDAVLLRVKRAVREFAAAAMFELAARGYSSLFQQVVGCILSIRTLDEVSLPAAVRLLERAPNAARMSALTTRAIDRLIGDVTFHERKAAQVLAIAKRTVSGYGGELPCEADVLLALPGIGPKCANLALGIACGARRISVDVHVWRVTTRWGYVRARSPEQAMQALERELPKRYWVEINRLLVPFGKHVCTGVRPRCSECPVLEYCRQVGVSDHR